MGQLDSISNAPYNCYSDYKFTGGIKGEREREIAYAHIFTHAHISQVMIYKSKLDICKINYV